MQPTVLIIVLCYNGVELTMACLDSLCRLQYAAADILVVDNASNDDTPAHVRARFPTITVLETGANLGFAAGNNVGLRYMLEHNYDYALLLNNDTEVAPDVLTTLVSLITSDPSVGVAGPTIYYAERPDTIWSAGGTIDWQRGTSMMRGNGVVDDGQYSMVRPVDFVSGCALLCKRVVLEKIGLLDERFFMYYEETEWCVRAQRAGFGVVHVPQSHVFHKIPLDARANQPYVAYYMTRNRLLFLQVTGAAAFAWVQAALFQDLRTCISLSIRRKWRLKRYQRDAMVMAWIDFLQQRFGRWNLM